MNKDQQILRDLAETLDPATILKKYHLQPAELKELLFRASSALAAMVPRPVQEKTEASFPPGEVYVLHVDGASRGNPGPAAAGFAIYHGGKMVEGQGQYLGELTNNQAEYNALILGLMRLKELKAEEVIVKTDSELMARQLNGKYRVKHPGLIKLFGRAKQLMEDFASVHVQHVPREENQEADRLANRALDEFGE